jgi:hypothetical protein
MTTWKDPKRVVWHTLRCSRCNTIINRAKLPGFIRETVYRVCEKCAARAPISGDSAKADAKRPAKD